MLGNHIISTLISRINFACKKRLRFIYVDLNDTYLQIIKILYINGAIRSYKIIDNNIIIYFKYHMSRVAINISVVSTPGNRVYWSLNNLSLFYNNHNFAGFYIVSTQLGLYSSDYCLLNGFFGGEVVLKVEV